MLGLGKGESFLQQKLLIIVVRYVANACVYAVPSARSTAVKIWQRAAATGSFIETLGTYAWYCAEDGIGNAARGRMLWCYLILTTLAPSSPVMMACSLRSHASAARFRSGI